jgi:putative phosphoserine phosphatase/1-acylglycerol-3-phosphate O-acyltransferase
MDLYSKVIKDVEASPDGPHIGAFFDFDGTIIYGYSATTYLREQIKRGDIAPKQLVQLTKTMIDFGLGNMGFSAMMMAASQYLEGIDEADYQEFGEKLYKKHIAKLIYPESRALIEAHLKKGHTVALISAATPYQVVPAARELGIPHVKCSKLEVVNGKFTGAVMKPTCYGMGKVDAAEQLQRDHDLDIQESFFYSDSDEDIQLLDFVGKPRPLNPNKKLRRIAKGRGWPVQDFISRGSAGISDYVKTFAAQASMVTSFVAGLPIYALTGSVNKTRNFSSSLFADTAAALTGIELDVEGEEHAWANRPCVFIFNHQSQADTIILPMLLRRDLAGVGKKEIADVPIIGKIMQLAGTVLIDRENSASAREAMAPLIDVMRNEGRSVCIAPEGTRSTSTNLGRFKKGAFHLAMQAGVPIVPIVIHNAIDVAPRGQYVLRPATVKVKVLPAIDTQHWSVENLDQHVHEVRDMFLVELDQMQFQPSEDEIKSLRKTKPKLKKVSAKAAKTKTAKTKINKPPRDKSAAPKSKSAPAKMSRRKAKPLANEKPIAQEKPLASEKPLANRKPKKVKTGLRKTSSKTAVTKKSTKPAIKKSAAPAAKLVEAKTDSKRKKLSKRTLNAVPANASPAKAVAPTQVPRRRAKKKSPPKVSARTLKQ